MNIPAQDLQAALKRCEMEAIHTPGVIQPNGALLVVDPANQTVLQASANLQEFLGVPPEAALGRLLAELITADNADKIQALPIRGDLQPSVPALFHLQRDNRQFSLAVQVHRSEGNWVLEMEFCDDSELQYFGHLFVATRNALWESDVETEFSRYAGFIADHIRGLIGFDRVMLYRFDSQWNGEVIAESRNDRLPSLLGHHFPSSDIPPQARRLYTRNLIRVLADVDAAAVPLVPVNNPLSGRPLDMSHAVLRSMSPIHLEYMRNMGARATVTISLMQGGKLWGLVACHHAEPRHTPFHLRELAEFVGKTVSLKLTNLENLERSTYMNQVRETLMTLTRCIRQAGDINQVISLLESDILQLVRATGGIIAIAGQHYRVGNVPAEQEIIPLVEWLKDQHPDEVFYTDHLAGFYPPATDWADRAAGLLAVRLDASFTDYILWFREERVRAIPWAGNPAKSLVVDQNGAHIEPRRSFALWVQEQRGRSLPWTSIETDAALSLSLTLIEVLTQKALRLSEQNYRLLAENSTDIISRHNQQGITTFISQSCFDLLGHHPEELLNRSCYDIILPEDHPTVKKAFASTNDSDRTQTILFRSLCRDGQILWMESTIKPIRHRQGNTEFVVISRDVTQRHEYQLAVEELQRRNASILNAAGEGVIGADGEGRITFANVAATDILGYSWEQMQGQSLSSLLALCDPQTGQSATGPGPIEDCLRTGTIHQNCEGCFTDQGGQCVPVDFIVTPMDNKDRRSGVVIVFRDISERRLIDAQLRQSSTVFEHAAEAIMVTDDQGVITAVNQAFEQITGYSKGEALGQTPSLLRSGRHDASFFQHMWQEIRDKRSWRGEIWNRRKNGEVYPQWGSIAAVLDSQGQIRNYVTVFSDISETKKNEAKLKFLANHDPLTGLPNRILLNDKLNLALARSASQNHQLAVVFLDLDHFKVINDTLGHLVGDSYLKEISRRLSETLRQDDSLARWGGDEFVIIIEDIRTREDVADIMQRLYDLLAAPLTIEGHDVIPSASAGIAFFPEDGDDPGKLIQAADTAMYRAKERGRNRFEFFTGQLSEAAQQRFQLAWELRRALNEDEFLLHYQPQCSALNGQLVGLEALIRWRHPARGLVPPLAFLPVAEEIGLIRDIGDWVLRAVCRQIAAWEAEQSLPPGVVVAVNIAPVQLDQDFAQRALETVRASGIPPERIEFEITEGALERREDALDTLNLFAAAGIRMSVDDFGTGYSSLSHLRDLPVSCFKIDKSFIDGVPGHRKDVAIVRTIVALGNSLGINIIAEGVEDREQLDFLREEGVETIQGYYFSRPIPPEEVLAFIADRALNLPLPH